MFHQYSYIWSDLTSQTGVTADCEKINHKYFHHHHHHIPYINPSQSSRFKQTTSKFIFPSRFV